MGLSDDALVIRGGLMEVASLRISVETCLRVEGFYGLSFFGADGLSIQQIATLAALPNGRIRVARMGALRGIGREPTPRGSFPHLSLEFPTSPTDVELEELAGVFGSDIPNPYPAE